ncbi:VOC family protein [Granulosicoccus sp. 3-233]|uniref:VOC family protein n=1 Tax=Granulosicoccus sp. 3-233 TaxID=3417969 RepID=UPI003D345117
MPTTLTPYLTFDGTTRQAFAYYEHVLNARINTMLSYDDIPAMDSSDTGSEGSTTPSGEGIMHACLELPGGAMLMAGDTPPGMPSEGISGVMMALQFDSNEQAGEIFNALSQDGQVTMPLAPTFWAEIFGMVTDQYGVSWAINGKAVEFD